VPRSATRPLIARLGPRRTPRRTLTRLRLRFFLDAQLFHQRKLAVREPAAELLQIELGLLQLGEQLVFLFLDVMLDVLAEHFDRRLEVLVVAAHALDLGDQLLRGAVLDLGLVDQVLFLLAFEGFLRSGVEHLFLDRRVHCQQLADALRDRGLLFLLRLLEFFEQRGHHAVVLFEERNRVARRVAAAAGCRSRSCHDALLKICL
jgi:hypothetical protein